MITDAENELSIFAHQPLIANDREAEAVRAKRRPAGKHTHLAIAAQAGRAHHGPPVCPHRLVKLKGQPKVAGGLQPTEGIFPVKRWLDNQLGPGMTGQPRLARHPELVLKA